VPFATPVPVVYRHPGPGAARLTIPVTALSPGTPVAAHRDASPPAPKAGARDTLVGERELVLQVGVPEANRQPPDARVDRDQQQPPRRTLAWVAKQGGSEEGAMGSLHARTRASRIALLVRQDFVGGLMIAAFAAFVYWQAADLPAGSVGGMGPGMLPKGLAVLLGCLGALLSISAVGRAGVPLGRLTLRGPLFVIGAVVLFGLAVRPLGLVVAGPLAILVGALATNEVRAVETIVVSVVVTAFCIGLFKFALGLPIPLAPWLLGY